MSIMSDRWITRMAREHRMIEPFEDRQVRKGVISYGVSSYGYDMRVAREFRIFTNVLSSIVDPKQFDPKSFVEYEGDVCIVPPNSFALARSVEYFRIPRNILTVTRRQVDVRAVRHHHQRHAVRARVGRLRHARDLEHDAPPGEDLRQRGDRAGAVLPRRGGTQVSYKDKGGKYQSQTGVTLPRL